MPSTANTEEKPMTITKLITPAEARHLDAYLDAVFMEFRRWDHRDRARAALRKVLDESDDPGQVRCLLFDAVIGHRYHWIPESPPTLAEFIESGKWRAENLPFNKAAA
jgi:hypothetical protein